MRGIFGLAGVLVTIGVIAWIMSEFYLPYTKAALNAKKSVQPTLNRLSSTGDDGLPAADSAALLPVERNGQLRGLAVQGIVTGGAMDTTYGLRPGDVILRIYGFAVGDPLTATVSDFAAAKDFLFVDAYRGHWPLTVDRGGTEITLPQDRNFTPPPPAAAPTTTGGAPAADPSNNP